MKKYEEERLTKAIERAEEAGDYEKASELTKELLEVQTRMS